MSVSLSKGEGSYSINRVLLVPTRPDVVIVIIPADDSDGDYPGNYNHRLIDCIELQTEIRFSWVSVEPNQRTAREREVVSCITRDRVSRYYWSRDIYAFVAFPRDLCAMPGQDSRALMYVNYLLTHSSNEPTDSDWVSEADNRLTDSLLAGRSTGIQRINGRVYLASIEWYVGDAYQTHTLNILRIR